MEEKTAVSQKFCEIEGVEDFNCIDCPEFNTCQLILYDSHDEIEDEENTEGNGLTIV